MNSPVRANATAAQGLADVDQAIFFNASPVPAFVIDLNHVVTHFNHACAMTLGVTADQVVGRKGIGRVFHGHDRPMMADMIVDGVMQKAVDDLYQSSYRGSLAVTNAYEAEAFFSSLGAAGQ